MAAWAPGQICLEWGTLLHLAEDPAAKGSKPKSFPAPEPALAKAPPSGSVGTGFSWELPSAPEPLLLPDPSGKHWGGGGSDFGASLCSDPSPHACFVIGQEGSPTPGSPAPRVEDENLAPESEVGVGAGDPSRMPLLSFLLAQGPKERVRASDSRADEGAVVPKFLYKFLKWGSGAPGSERNLRLKDSPSLPPAAHVRLPYLQARVGSDSRFITGIQKGLPSPRDQTLDVSL
ncbi:hypothetical protein MJG53_012646 [Ovis ammon polii x Ovis aries]|uniref:Uncharacterized protein n=1 Tax=Ovis ammon polii x Ovis aries TaxID=2918886 RepID=A0ACB9ULG8_9CETA|nr:hypothetical protein MJG53_012646 [Ovis ammon polii x Ovis aries]